MQFCVSYNLSNCESNVLPWLTDNCFVPKVGQMFNALGLGFSFVLSFLILPEEGDDESEGIGESKNGTDCSNSSLTLEDLTPVGWTPPVIETLSFIPSHSSPLFPLLHSFIFISYHIIFLHTNPLISQFLTIKVDSFKSLMFLQYVHAGITSILLLLVVLYFPRCCHHHCANLSTPMHCQFT